VGLTVVKYDTATQQVQVKVTGHDAAQICKELKQRLIFKGKGQDFASNLVAKEQNLYFAFSRQELLDVWNLCQDIFAKYQSAQEESLERQLLKLGFAEKNALQAYAPTSKSKIASKWFLSLNYADNFRNFCQGFGPIHFAPYKITRWDLFDPERVSCAVRIPNDEPNRTENFIRKINEKQKISFIVKKNDIVFEHINGIYFFNVNKLTFANFVTHLSRYALKLHFNKTAEEVEELAKAVTQKILAKLKVHNTNEIFQIDFRRELFAVQKELALAGDVSVSAALVDEPIPTIGLIPPCLVVSPKPLRNFLIGSSSPLEGGFTRDTLLALYSGEDLFGRRQKTSWPVLESKSSFLLPSELKEEPKRKELICFRFILPCVYNEKAADQLKDDIPSIMTKLKYDAAQIKAVDKSHISMGFCLWIDSPPFDIAKTVVLLQQLSEHIVGICNVSPEEKSKQTTLLQEKIQKVFSQFSSNLEYELDVAAALNLNTESKEIENSPVARC